MKLSRGLNLDISPANTPEGFYVYGKNGIINDDLGTVENESGFTNLGILPDNHKMCGYIEMDENRTIVFTHDDSNETEAEDPDSFYVRYGGTQWNGQDATIVYLVESATESSAPSGRVLDEGVSKVKLNGQYYNVVEKGVSIRKIGTEPLEYNYIMIDKQDTEQYALFALSMTQITKSGGVDYIGYVEHDTYKAVSTSFVFNFSPAHPVTGTYRYTASGEIEFVFRDGINKPKIATIIGKAELKEDTLEKMKLFPNYSFPKITLTSIDRGGNLEEGTYYFSIRYIKDDTGVTECFPVSKGVKIYSQKARPKGDIVNAGKSITLQISNVDQKYDKLQVMVIVSNKDVLSSYALPVYNINSSTLQFRYSGNENKTSIPVEEILVTRPVYDDVRCFETLDNRLYGGGGYTEASENMQERANDIIVQWFRGPSNMDTAIKLPPDERALENGTYLNRIMGDKEAYLGGFRDGEVYALYISYIKNGRLTKAYHIPGRAPRTQLSIVDDSDQSRSVVGTTQNPAETWTITDIQDYITTNYSQPTTYLDDDNSLGNNVRYFQTRDTAYGSIASQNQPGQRDYQYGMLAYWQNENEVYADDYQGTDGNGIAFAGQKVRHHKIPTDRTLMELKNSSGAAVYENPHVFSLYFNNVDFEGYDGYVIFYAKPEISRMGQGIIFNRFNGFDFHESVNSRVYTLSESDTDDNATGARFRFHDFGLMYDKPALEPTHFESCLRYFPAAPLEVVDRFLDNNTENIRKGSYFDLGVPNSLEGYWKSSSNTLLQEKDKHIIKIKPGTARYVPTDNSAADNALQEECIIGELEDITLTLTSYPLGDMCVYKEDFYFGYENQTLINTGGMYTVGSYQRVNGGDTYVNNFSLDLKRKKGSTTSDGLEPDGYDGSNRYDHFQITLTSIPSRYDYGKLLSGNDWWNSIDYTVAFAPTKILDVQSLTREQIPEGVQDARYAHKFNPNYVDFVPDHTRLNEFTAVEIFDNVVDISGHNNRVIRSILQSNESNISSWREFLPADYYELTKDSGPIVKIEAYKGELIIRTTGGMFVTRGKAQLQTDAVAVTLGTGDIFQYEPVNVLKGYGGINNWYNSRVTRVGVVSVDPNNNKVFMYSQGQLQDITPGVRTYLRGQDLANTKIAWDDYYNRILFCNTLYTLSYSMYTNSWAFFHDYWPQYIWGTRNLYSTYVLNGSSKLYQHNTGPVGQYYENWTYVDDQEQTQTYVWPTMVDVSFNPASTFSKVLANIEYIDEVISTSNIRKKNNSMTHISVRNDTQHTGLVSLSPKLTFYGIGNLDKEKDNWIYREIRDLVDDSSSTIVGDISSDYNPVTSNLKNKPFYEREDMVDKYAIVRFYNDNKSTDKWKLFEVSANFLSPQ